MNIAQPCLRTIAGALLSIFVFLLLAFVFVDDAHAHGGRPQLGEPPVDEEEDPPPPPPPPPVPPQDPPPTGGDVNDTKGRGETAPDPSAGGDPGGPTTGGDRGRPSRRKRGRAAASSGPPSWLAWWQLNRWAYLPDRTEVAYRQARQTTGVSVDAARADREQRARTARRDVIPLLLKLLHPRARVPDEVRASALIALAKLSNDSATATLAFTYARDRHAASMVRESAALALGLMRRSDPSLRAPARELDRLRDQLLDLYDDEGTPWRTRAFAVLAVGLLGDQPFGSGITRDGLMVSRALWTRLGGDSSNRELTVALLDALGHQPLAGIPEAVRDDVRGIATGRRVYKRRWSDVERSHAITAVVRLGVPGWETWLMRTLASRHTPGAVQRAACLAIGARADALTPDQRKDVARMWSKAQARARHPLNRGLLRLAQGRLLAADFADGRVDLLSSCRFGAELIEGIERDNVAVRGFSTLGLALAARAAAHGPGRAADDAPLAHRFAKEARQALQERFRKRRGGPGEQGAVAVALGLVGADQKTRDELSRRIADSNADETLRGQCAVALAQCAPRHPSLRKSLAAALWDRQAPELRSEAALALSFMPRSGEADTLMVAMRNERSSQWVLGQIAAALGRLADVRVVPEVIEAARNEKLGDHARGIAVASLALICDPEPRPSLLRLTLDSNYPARTNALDEAFTIL